MRMPLSSLLATAALGLALAPAAFADEATQDLNLVRDSCGGGSTVPPDTRLAFDLGASTLGCGSTLAFVSPATTSYPARQGVPVVIDGSRSVLVAITMTSYLGVAVGGVGDETITVTLSGKRKVGSAPAKTETIGSKSSTIPAAEMARNPEYTAEFDLPVGTKAGLYTALTLDVTVAGSAGGGFLNHDGTSFVSLPVFDPIEEPTEEGA